MPYKDKEKQREAQRKWEKENRGAGKRHKVWMFIFYPDTAEVGWRDECGVTHIADALDRQNPRLALDARDSVEELRKLKVSHLGALAFTRPAQHGYVPLHG